MRLDKMIELYATGDWILISKMQLCNWHKTSTFNLQENHYELIHKKHYDVLDHMLNGGKIKVKTTVVGDWRIIDNINDFILDYNESFTYKVIKDKPVVERTTREEAKLEFWQTRNSSRHGGILENMFGSKSNEDFKILQNGKVFDDYLNKIFDYIEYLEAKVEK